MTQGKVKLPREVTEAIEALRAEKHEDDYILWFSCRDDAIESENPYWNILFTFVDGVGNSFLLADALRYGYIVDEPITVTITPGQVDKLIEFYEEQISTQGVRGNVIASVLAILGIKIPEVND